jgi:hypothetical protein
LPNDAAAKEYAHRIIRQFKEAGGYDNPDLKMIVKNSDSKVTHLIRF